MLEMVQNVPWMREKRWGGEMEEEGERKGGREEEMRQKGVVHHNLKVMQLLKLICDNS